MLGERRATLAQHYTNIGPIYRVCWKAHPEGVTHWPDAVTAFSRRL